MQDGIIKGTGNSRYLKSISDFLTQYPTYQDFAAALAAGTLPIDLNGINPTGWDQLGTALNTANLLSAETAALYSGLSENPVPNSVFEKLSDALLYKDGLFYSPDGSSIDLANQLFVTGTYNGNMSNSDTKTSRTIDLGFNPSCVIVSNGGTRFQDGRSCEGAIALRERPAYFFSQSACVIQDSGFIVYQYMWKIGNYTHALNLNSQGETYNYIAFR